MNGNAQILPDSRLQNQDFGVVVADWSMMDGTTVRIQVVPVFCASCGAPYGYVPKENTAFTCWLCRQCYEQYGAIANSYAQPDEEFCRDVAYEMEQRFGRGLTEAEVIAVTEQGQLGPALEALARESPYAARDHRPRSVS